MARDDEVATILRAASAVASFLPHQQDRGGVERHLSIRKFSDKMAQTAYARQNGKYPICGKKFTLEQMQADHVRPWSKRGRTTADNCQMLCRDCNRRKGAK